MTVKTIKSDRNADTGFFELDYASGVVLTITQGAAAQSVGPFNSALVLIKQRVGDLSVRGDGVAATPYGNGTLPVFGGRQESYVPVDAGKTLSLCGTNDWTSTGGTFKTTVIPVKAS